MTYDEPRDNRPIELMLKRDEDALGTLFERDAHLVLALAARIHRLPAGFYLRGDSLPYHPNRAARIG